MKVTKDIKFNFLNADEQERYQKQLTLKEIGTEGQLRLKNSSVLCIGAGGIGSSALIYLAAAGIGTIGIVDNDLVSLSNIHRQSLYDVKDLNKSKIKCVKKKLNKINPKVLVKTFNSKITPINVSKLITQYDIIVDGSDNFKTKLLVNDYSLKLKKFLVLGAISKLDGHIFTYNFKNKKTPCLRCFFQEDEISDDILNCEYDGILGTVAGIVGALQANEVLKHILNIGKNLDSKILILDLLNLNFRKVKIIKQKNCIC